MPVRFRSSAPRAASSMAERQALNLCRSGFKSLVAHHAGVKGIGIPRELRPRGLRVRLAPSAPDGHWGNMADPPGPGPGVSWFEARMASFAAAHGCGPALVRRVTRVGTGWRLQWPDASPRLRSSSGQSVSSVRRRSSVRIGPEAPCDRSVSG